MQDSKTVQGFAYSPQDDFVDAEYAQFSFEQQGGPPLAESDIF